MSGKVVQPRTPHFMPQIDAGDRRPTRLDLAKWLVARDNPLTARVVVNRLWKRYFGVGLSKELIDLGSRGEVPPNQELLDWLAVEFMEPAGGHTAWDIKHMIRLMVTTSAYRQSSLPRAELEAIDPENRLVARQIAIPAGSRANSRQCTGGERLAGAESGWRGGAAVPAGQVLFVAQLSGARLHGVHRPGPIPPCGVRALAKTILAPLATGVRCANPRRVYGGTANLQHAVGGACAA